MDAYPHDQSTDTPVAHGTTAQQGTYDLVPWTARHTGGVCPCPGCVTGDWCIHRAGDLELPRTGFGTPLGDASPGYRSHIPPPSPPDYAYTTLVPAVQGHYAHGAVQGFERSREVQPSGSGYDAGSQVSTNGVYVDVCGDTAQGSSFRAGLAGNDGEAMTDERGLPTEARVVRVFACAHDDCHFTASSRKDIRRHMRADKHRDDHAHATGDRYYCEVAGCKVRRGGFSRRDNMLRHMSVVHDIEPDRERRGRKRNGEA